MKVLLGKEKVIVQGMTLEENQWGKYQFPTPYLEDDKIILSVFVDEDTLINDAKPERLFESRDKGETWNEIPYDGLSRRGVKLPNGDRIYFPTLPGIDLSEYEIPSLFMLTPDSDLSKAGEGKKFPLQDGLSTQGGVIRAYLAERLPYPLCEKKWSMERIKAGETDRIAEEAQLDWPYLTRVVVPHKNTFFMKSIHPIRCPKIAPDGSVWISVFSGEGHINPKNGQYSPYYSAEILRSVDNGKTFKLHAHMEYPADGDEFPYLSGGFSDNDYEFMDDGSIIWFFRSTWFGSTGVEWAPMYFSRSTDGGVTWTKPEVFAPMGVFPSLCKLNCGATLLAYGRPGLFVTACESNNSEKWMEPITVIEAKDRSHLANIKIDEPTWRYWDGQCGNATLIPAGDNEALLFYGDFYYPDEKGVKRKTILCRKITVLPED